MNANNRPSPASAPISDASASGPGKPADKPRVQSVARASAILSCVGESDAGLSAAEIRARTGLPMQATYHLLQSLQVTGMLRRSSQNKYVLGLRIGDLIDGFRKHFSCPDELRAMVKRIAESTGETCYVSGWFDDDLVSLAIETGWNPVQASGGTRHLSGYIHARASGKLLLALSSPETQEAFFAAHALSPLTENTLTSETALRQEFQDILNNGYAMDREEFALGLTCLAVPLRLAGTTYAVCVSAPTQRMNVQFDTIRRLLEKETTQLW